MGGETYLKKFIVTVRDVGFVFTAHLIGKLDINL